MRNLVRRFVPCALLVAIVLSCGKKDSTVSPTPGPPTALAKQAGDNQSGSVGAAVTVAPSVKVTDASNRAVPGVSVTFAVGSGGGSVTGATVTTGTDGVANVGSWTLGTALGANTLTATSGASGVTGSPATFTATATAGPPKTLTKQAGDNLSAAPGTAVATAPAVKVVDQFNNPVSGVVVTFAVATGGGTLTGATPSTGANGVATVGSWTLGATAGSNTITATAAGAGITGNPATFTATGIGADFNPTSNTTIGGTVNFSSVTIPTGVTVTVSSDLVLTTTGAVTIAGTLSGDCKIVSITATARLNVSGNIDNKCAVVPDGGPPALTLVGKGGYHFTGGGRTTTSGDLFVTNDPALNPAALRASSLSMAPPPRVTASANAIDYDCESVNRTWVKDPPSAQDGANGGPFGMPGKPGKVATLSCRGNGFIDNTTVTGQDGGRGGSATHTSSVAAVATGGAGGAGGLLLVYVTAQLDFGTNNTLSGGSGGNGGTATATSTPNTALGAGPPADATGGKGGDGATITVRGLGGITVAGGLTFNVGHGGQGGDATAIAADGVNATATKAAQPGGTATAKGGDGGSSPDKTLTASGTVGGAGTVTVTGGQGGQSGLADATGGKGGDGVIENKDGAIGGGINAMPGRGGNANVKNLAGALVGPGGTSNDAFFRRGLGGNGYSDCTAPLSAGGKGGDGGPAAGGSRFGGTGAPNGADGVTREIIHSNGGNGGHGLGPGKRGEAGANNIVAIGVPIVTEPVFKPGVPGRGCRFMVTLTVQTDPNPQHEPFVQYTTITIIDAFVDNALNTIRFTGVAGGKWITVSGMYNQTTGAFNATGAGTAAGIANVPATFTGSINLATGQITGLVTLFGDATTPPNGLPGHSVSYMLTGMVIGVTPAQ
ncbi:MAG TPA: hypothetical protein VHE78_19425 [Gemmatimonadaceae bacterium]|nr:hypothetical protein [Gemmatimonadaceae bacterium]